jgi:hypothetical protein
MKVHITLSESATRDVKAKRSLMRRISEISQIKDVNVKRFEKYGILSGEIGSSETLLDLRALDGVADVSLDQVQKAI